MSVHILEGTVASADFEGGKVRLELKAPNNELILVKSVEHPPGSVDLFNPGKKVRFVLRKAIFDKKIHVVQDVTTGETIALEEHQNSSNTEFLYLLGGWLFVVLAGVLLTLTYLLAIVGIPILIYALVIFPFQRMRDRGALKTALSEFSITKHETRQYAAKL